MNPLLGTLIVLAFGGTAIVLGIFFNKARKRQQK